jgi:hypothetical protein
MTQAEGGCSQAYASAPYQVALSSNVAAGYRLHLTAVQVRLCSGAGPVWNLTLSNSATFTDAGVGSATCAGPSTSPLTLSNGGVFVAPGQSLDVVLSSPGATSSGSTGMELGIYAFEGAVEPAT